LKGYGYGRSCDYWAVGITLYKLYYGKYPFGESSNTAIEVYKDISEGKLTFPFSNDKESSNIRSLLRVVLNKTVASRPCSLKEISNHINEELKWGDLVNMTFEPPIFPSIDLSTFQFFNSEDKFLVSKANMSLHSLKGLKYKPQLIIETLRQEKINNLPESGDLFENF
jgi:hypothetical protein